MKLTICPGCTAKYQHDPNNTSATCDICSVKVKDGGWLEEEVKKKECEHLYTPRRWKILKATSNVFPSEERHTIESVFCQKCLTTIDL